MIQLHEQPRTFRAPGSGRLKTVHSAMKTPPANHEYDRTEQAIQSALRAVHLAIAEALNCPQVPSDLLTDLSRSAAELAGALAVLERSRCQNETHMNA